MGDDNIQLPLQLSADHIKPVRILVTGYGLFGQYPTNPSWEILQRLPDALQKGRIQIVKYPQPLRVSYHDVATLIPALLEEEKPDLVLHLGFAPGRSYWSLERQAPRGPYDEKPDVEHRVFSREEAQKLFGNSPAALMPTLDIPAIFRDWQETTKDVKKCVVKVSDDPGNFLCGFIYYTSLSHYYQRREERPVIFCHVPLCEGEAQLAAGTVVVEKMIEAMADSTIEGSGRSRTNIVDQHATIDARDVVSDDANAGMLQT